MLRAAADNGARVRMVREALREKHKKWYLLRLANLSTIMREWAALHAIDRLAFRSTLLAAKPVQRQAPPSALVLPKARRTAISSEKNTLL